MEEKVKNETPPLILVPYTNVILKKWNWENDTTTHHAVKYPAPWPPRYEE